jgi:hypothetical protein
MSIIAQYSFRGLDLGLLGIAFPQTPVLHSPFPSFVPAKRIVVISESDPFPWYREKEVIQIISTADIQLDTRDGFLRFLGQSGVRASHDQVKQLLDLVDEQFWPEAKAATVLKHFPNLPKVFVPNEHSTVLDIFEHLFENFDAVCRHYYRLSPKPNNAQLVSWLITMMMKTEAPQKVDGSWRYKKLLKKNLQYLQHFKRAVFQYIENEMPLNSTMSNLHFLALAAECSEHTRPETFHLPDDITLENLDMHIKFGFDSSGYNALVPLSVDRTESLGTSNLSEGPLCL